MLTRFPSYLFTSRNNLPSGMGFLPNFAASTILDI
jgi:hypothetical protein